VGNDLAQGFQSPPLTGIRPVLGGHRDAACPEGAIRLQPRVSTLGTVSPLRRALKGLQISRVMPPIRRIVISRPFRANPLTRWFPGLKPWAESYSPFGAINRPKYSLSSRHSPSVDPYAQLLWPGRAKDLAYSHPSFSFCNHLGFPGFKKGSR
jgi:hypothetical protein